MKRTWNFLENDALLQATGSLRKWLLVALFALVLFIACGGAGAAQRAPTLSEVRELASLAEQVLELKHLACVGGVRTVAVTGRNSIDVICGYSNAYHIDFDLPAAFIVSRVEYPQS